MSLKDRLMSDLRDAMRSGDELRKSTIRMARAAIESAEGARRSELLATLLQEAGVEDAAHLGEGVIEGANIEERSKLDDAGIEAVLATAIKQRREAAEAYARHNRPELAAKEQAEASILEGYLPKQMSEEEIEGEVRTLITELGATGAGDMKRVMPAAMSRLKGKAEGRTINKVVTRLLSGGSAH
ncbi:MAG TPA: GatB/YqeY domain-containing protein [Chloroflexia bacterium]|nr:GatB/YqeY domain-containing protein [Chloroflexia bacterium]